ncbi:glycoside hydrolase family 28 protein [Loktanella sp. TSTF-M6]|uniref:Glycoside hydrolase family 28 protein n=1 Tax=Loktanella gaetbuli TaxID=2881335 RepID=A0ABS8BXG6_9RHOB|nr:glycoside hydrolase family 28 protein [Loktanella gaetbuli]MCB5200441.1 glycoside hydrolase family 28 protein [Loktanella gaetbuli]
MLNVLAITPYTATILIHADKARYHLDAPVSWRLEGADQGGVSHTVPVFIEGLAPDTSYTFATAEEAVRFTTKPCAGLIDATDFGVAAGAANNADAFARAIDAVPTGGTLLVPAGRFASGPLFLKSDMTFWLADGAILEAVADRGGWPILPEHDDTGRVIGTWEGLPAASFASPVTAIGCANLAITGRGTLDGGGDRGDWWHWPKETRDGARRPRTLFLAHCTDTVLSGITVRNSPSWTVHPFRCDRLTAAALHIRNPADSPNTDGFDPESCTQVQLRGLHISVGDDCIAVKAGKRGTGDDTRVDHIAPTRHLTIANCLMEDGHGAVVMGSEMSGDITDVDITRCAFKGTDRGLRIKTRRGRGGQVSRITMDDVVMDGVGTALAINAFYFCDADGKSAAVQSRDPAPVDDTTPQVSDITISNLRLRGVRHAAGAFLGLPEAPVRGLRLSGITIDYDATAEAGETLMACHLPPARHAGLLHRFAMIQAEAALTEILEDLNDVG